MTVQGGTEPKVRPRWTDHCVKCGKPVDIDVEPSPHIQHWHVSCPAGATAQQHDAVNHPAHYTQGKVECIDAIEAAIGADGVRAFCRGNAIKYLWRAGAKGDLVEDLRKARWYFEREIASRTSQAAGG